MTASRRAGAPNFPEPMDPVGSDLPRVDTHVITQAEYEEIPELDGSWTAPLEGGPDHPRGRGRPRSASPKQRLTLRLAPEIVAHFRAGGPGWQTRMEDVLRAAMSVERDEAERSPQPPGGAPTSMSAKVARSD